ncbi:MAG: hypothetical protein ACYDCK_04410 [Thermoplasmatota archaeon]
MSSHAYVSDCRDVCGARIAECDFCTNDARHWVDFPSDAKVALATLYLCEKHAEPFNRAVDEDLTRWPSEVAMYMPGPDGPSSRLRPRPRERAAGPDGCACDSWR